MLCYPILQVFFIIQQNLKMRIPLPVFVINKGNTHLFYFIPDAY